MGAGKFSAVAICHNAGLFANARYRPANGLFAIGSSDINVSLATATGKRTYTITFVGNLAAQDVPQISAAVRGSQTSSLVREISFSFDEASRLTGTTDPAAEYDYVYDDLGRVLQENQNYSASGLNPLVELSRSYDAVGNRLGLSAKLITGGTTVNDYANNYYYDALNRLTQVDQSAMGGVTPHGVAEKRVNLQYNALGQYTFVNRFENLSATNPALRSVYTYDKANRLTELAHRHNLSQSSSTLLARYQFSYDALNRITSINSYLDGVSNFTHDLRGQLTNATHANPRPAEQFNYDDNGNRTGGSYATGTNNQTTSDGTYTYTFDSEGNRTRRTKVSDNSYEDYTWDHRNRLTSVTRKSQAGTVLATATYVYD